MPRATAAMSLEASDVQTDEDCEDLAEDSFSFSADMSEHEKRTRKMRSSGKPPPSPTYVRACLRACTGSPYLTSLNVNPKRAAVSAWRLPRASKGESTGERIDPLGDTASARLTALSNGHDLSQTVRSECDITPEILRQTLTARKHKQSRSASNGYTLGTADYREKEDMYDEIIRLKKSLQAQRSDNQQMKAKLRRLEEDKTKREKQIEELLDPTRGSEYTRSFVDKKKDGSVVVNGLKQRILKLEQQCREKENALSKLQSELRTTNLEELKITVDTYFEEIQRLRMLLEAAEKSSRAESKGSLRQQKALSSTVLRLSENLKQLQQENTALREELNTDSPVGGIKGYREWSKQRLVRRLLEVEKRLEDSRRHAHSAKSSSRLDQEVQTTPTEIVDSTQRVTMATEAVVPTGTTAEQGEEVSVLKGSVSQLEKEREELQETLTSKDDELKRLTAAREELERETERWKAEQTSERETERQEHKQELEQLWLRIQALEEDRSKPAPVEPSPSSPSAPEKQGSTKAVGGLAEGEEEEEAGGREKQQDLTDEQGEQRSKANVEDKIRSEDRWKKEREKAASTIQTSWREHRERDIVMLQSALRGHLLRDTQLRDLQKDTHNKAILASSSSDVTSSADRELDAVALTMIQSVFRGHLARCGFATESSESFMPSPVSNSLPTLAPRRTTSTYTPSGTAQMELHRPPDSGAAAANDSDDSDDIIMSPSRPLRTRETMLL
ncbi:IQ domain-containing protein E [Polymixia lowei]